MMFTRLATFIGVALAAASSGSFGAVVPRQSSSSSDTKVGYFLTSFPVWDEAIYMHLSNGNSPHSYKRLSYNGSEAILRSNLGTKGVRDSFIVPAVDGSKYWLHATDLNGNAFGNNFNEASKFGSRSFVVWESTDLANWSEPRLTPALVNETAGNVWAPESNWDSSVGAYVTVFASRFWPESDTARNGTQPPNTLMYVTTTDFQNFSEAKTYYQPGFPVIDATFLHYPEEGENVWYRWVKSEVDYKVFQQKSTNGILGTWTNVGNANNSARVEYANQYFNNEGPLCFRDNVNSSLFHLWIDENTKDSYIPATATTLDSMDAWQPETLDGFPEHIKHGKVFAVNQTQYDAINNKYQVVS